MIWRRQKWFVWSEIFLSWLVLLAIIFYTYVELVEAPYLGFNFNSTTGDVRTTFVPNTDVAFMPEDRLHSVNGQSFEAWRVNLRAALFPPMVTGDLLQLEVERGGTIIPMQWRVPGFNWDEFRNRALNTWWMGYIFWLAGLATLLFVRPFDLKRSLFAAFFFLTALWLVVGNTSRWGTHESRIIYRMALCLSVPVILHLHWLFPLPLRRMPGWVWAVAYVGSLIYGLLHLTPYVGPSAATLTFGAALLGSLVLLLLHYWRQPEVRPQVRLLYYALVFAVTPIVALTVTVAAGASNLISSYGLLVMPIIPGAYFYSIYRHQPGGIEFRANRVIAVYLYLILVGTSLLMIAAMLSGAADFADSAVLWIALLGMGAALVTHYGFPAFQRVVDRRLLALPLPPVHLLETYLARITTTLNEPSLVQLLKTEVLPSLLVRQSALLRIRNQEATTIYATGEPGDGIAPEVVRGVMEQLRQQPFYRVTTLEPRAKDDWVRLALALQVEGKLIGVWLLGRHDPDDYFSPVDITVLQTLARQTALALANIDQAAQLQALYQASIERQEQERMKMAHFLHDAILNQAAVLYMSLDVAALTPRVETAYATLKDQIHQMVSNLRPPSLDFGLSAALEELVGELEERTAAKVELRLHLPHANLEYPAQIENHIFRIVQQACENAHRHARATTIQISGTLAPAHVELAVEDDGLGFAVDRPLNMAELLAHKHFGLVHMMERAEHIHADLALESMPGRGTCVRLAWINNGQSNNGQSNNEYVEI